MNKFKTLLIVLIGQTSITQGQASLDRILERHFEATGQAALESVRSLKMEVTEIDGFGKGSKYEVTKKRPLRIRKEGEDTGVHFILASDGQLAWEKSSGQAATQLDSSWLNKLKIDAVIGSPLILSQRPGYSLEHMGNGYIERNANHIIRMYFPDYTYMDFYIDKRDYLLKKIVTYSDFFEQTVETQIYFDNYRRLGPYLFSYKQQRQLTLESPVVDVVIGEIAVGLGADNSIFSLPEQ